MKKAFKKYSQMDGRNPNDNVQIIYYNRNMKHGHTWKHSSTTYLFFLMTLHEITIDDC